MDTGDAAMTVAGAAEKLLDLVTPDEEEIVEETEADEQETEPEAELAEGEEEAEPEDEDEELEEGPELHRVRVDGEEIEVPYDELVAGYSRYADYQRKTTALASERREFEGVQQEVMQQRAQFAALLPRIIEQAENALGPEPDWNAMTPEQQMVAHRERQQAKEAIAQARAEEAAQRQQLQAEQMRALQAYAEQQKAQLSAKITDIDTVVPQLREYAMRDLGFTEQELGGIYDHRFYMLAHKAMLYDRATAQQPKPKARKKSAKPGGRDAVPKSKRKRDEVLKQHQRSGTVESAAAAFMAMED